MDHMKFSPASLTLALVVVILLCGTYGMAASPSVQAIEQMAEDYFAQREVKPFNKPLSMPEALVAQSSFVKRLERRLGKPVGYKVGLVTREMQERFGVESPVRGVLLDKMLLPNRSEVALSRPARQHFRSLQLPSRLRKLSRLPSASPPHPSRPPSSD